MPPDAEPRISPDPSVDRLKQQLAQLNSLLAEGVLTGEAARNARDDLERRMLAAVLAEPPAGAEPAAASAAAAAPAAAAAAPARPAARPSRKLLLRVAAFMIALTAAGYTWLGNRQGWSVGPGEPGAAPADAAAPHSTDSAQIDAMIERLAERLKSKPDDADGWAMLARSYTSQGRHADALPAYKKALELRPKDAQAMADYADGLAVMNNRSLDGEPEKLIMEAVKIDPANVKALSLAGTVAFNHGDFAAAVKYWDGAVSHSEPGSDFTRQLQAALNEARQQAGLPPLPVAPAPAAADAGGSAATAGASGGTVSGRVTLADAVKGKVAADDTVFIFARAPTGSKMPLAILRKKVSDLPLDFKLDDSLAMSPAARLSSAPQVVVGARVSKSGNAVPGPGDWQTLSAPVAVGARDLRLEINEPVR